MVAASSVALFLALSTVAAGVTPVEKAITLLEDLKTQVESEGKTEAENYDKYACFCKDKTETKSKSVTEKLDKVDQLSADIEEGVAQQAEKQEEIKERQKKQEALSSELTEVTAKCQAEMAVLEADVADLTKAKDALQKATKALKNSKGAALLEVQKEVSESLAVADALNLIKATKQTAIQAFLQQGVDPESPEYKFRSGEILDTLEKLQTDFTTKLDETQKEWDKAKEACNLLKDNLTNQLDENEKAMKQLKDDVDALETKVAEAREQLVSTQDLLKDDSFYLKDLTAQCEDKAKDWDQRSQMRAGEIKALSEALVVLKEGKDGGPSVKALDEDVNKRALLLQGPSAGAAPQASKGSQPVGKAAAASPVGSSSTAAAPAAPSFLQALLRSSSLRGGALTSVQTHRHSQERAADILRSAGIRLKSGMLSNLAMKVASDPFAKVKALIQNLIERLLNEATQEATKQGFCDTELGKAKNDRDARFEEITKSTAELGVLEAKKDELSLEIEDLKEAIPKTWQTVNETASLRKEEKEANLKTISTAKEGFEAVSEAITILKAFYKSAEKAKALLQASPVDEDTKGPGFDGAYRGQQESSTGIIGLLEVIQSDFDRTARKTEEAEAKAQAEFVEFDRTSRVDIKSKETQLQIDQEELKSIESAIEQKIKDTETAQSLLDAALKTIEDLKPMCIDTGMSYKERTAKRDEEIAALKRALCALDPDKVEEECA